MRPGSTDLRSQWRSIALTVFMLLLMAGAVARVLIAMGIAPQPDLVTISMIDVVAFVALAVLIAVMLPYLPRSMRG